MSDPTEPPAWAETAVNRIICALYERAGFDHWYDHIADEDKREIDQELARIIASAAPKDEDSRRLDWLDDGNHWMKWKAIEAFMYHPHCLCLRAAIDAAMKGAE